MDYEKLAANYIACWGPDTIKIKADLAQAFERVSRSAHLRGMEEMRERAAKLLEQRSDEKFNVAKAIRDTDPKGNDLAVEAFSVLENTASEIRSLPLEPTHKVAG